MFITCFTIFDILLNIFLYEARCEQREVKLTMMIDISPWLCFRWSSRQEPHYDIWIARPLALTPHTQLGVLHYNHRRSPQRMHLQRRGDWVNILPAPRERLGTLLHWGFPVNVIGELRGRKFHHLPYLDSIKHEDFAVGCKYNVIPCPDPAVGGHQLGGLVNILK